MPTFSQYVAADRPLRPDEKGFAAFETAGRRIGPLYREAGQDMARIGELQRQGIEARRWPFDILALEQRSQQGSQQSGGIRVRLGHDPMNQFPGGSMAAHHALLQGGDDLSAWFAAANRQAYGNAKGGMLIDTETGTTMIGNKTLPGTYDPTRFTDLTGNSPYPPNPNPDASSEGVIPNDQGQVPNFIPGKGGTITPYTQTPDYQSLTSGSGPGQIGNSTTTPQSNTGDGGGGFFDSLGSFLNNLSGGDNGGADIGSGAETGM